jgi:hypothetical protein
MISASFSESSDFPVKRGCRFGEVVRTREATGEGLFSQHDIRAVGGDPAVEKAGE